MTLEEKLAAIREGSAESIPADVLSEMHRATEELKGSGIEGRALSAGEFPGFSLPDTEGVTKSLTGLREPGPLVVSFYRGVW